MLRVNQFRCPQDHRCPLLRICPAGAIQQEGYGLPVVDEEKCAKCMLCVRSCPMGAVEVVGE